MSEQLKPGDRVRVVNTDPAYRGLMDLQQAGTVCNVVRLAWRDAYIIHPEDLPFSDGNEYFAYRYELKAVAS